MNRIEELKSAMEGKTLPQLGELAHGMGFKAVYQTFRYDNFNTKTEWRAVMWDGSMSDHGFGEERTAQAWAMRNFVSYWAY